MRHHPAIPFEQSTGSIEGALVLLDVDGTLLPDGANDISPNTVSAVRQLVEKNDVYLVSNGNDAERIGRFSVALGISVAPAGVPAGKPFKSAMTGIDAGGKPVIVMGDKYLTDGLFARAVGARFILMERKRSGTERATVRLSYFLDRVVSWFL